MLPRCRIPLGPFPGLPPMPTPAAYPSLCSGLWSPKPLSTWPIKQPCIIFPKDLEVKSQPLGAAWDVGRGEGGRAFSCSDLVSLLLSVARCHRLSHQLCYIRPSGWTAGETKVWTPKLRNPAQDTVSSTPILLPHPCTPLTGSAIPALP